MVQNNRRTRILAVEDDLTTRAALFGLLADESFEVVLTKTAEGGLAQLRTKGFDVVLTDDRLPGHTGFWLASRAREEGLLPYAQVLMLSGDPAAQTNEWLTIVRKPLEAGGLVKVVGALLEKIRGAAARC
ncbi:MAG: Adenylate cyclase [Myxococcaceae bacterium]|nr:Adenylate cyclase [Myxococcaceae bacterium]